jgi:MFS family permease
MIGLTLGVVLFAGYVAHALRARVTPLIDLRLFASAGFTASVSIMFLVGGTLFSLLFLLPLYYQQVRVHNVFTAGLLVMPLGVGAMTGMPVAGRLADTLGAKLLVPIGGALIAAGAIVYRQADAGTPQVMLTASQVVIGLGLGLVGAPTMGSVYRTVVSDKVGAATAAVFILNQTGASLGIAIAAFLIQRRGADDSGAAAFGDAFWWPLSAGLVILVAGLLLPGRPQSRPAARATEAEAESAFVHPA